MTITVNHYHAPDSYKISVRLHFDESMASRLDAILHNQGEIKAMLKQLLKLENTEMVTLADIRAKVEAEKTVEDSAITLLQSISQQLHDAIASNDPAAMQAVADMLDSDTAALAAAVTANTPAA